MRGWGLRLLVMNLAAVLVVLAGGTTATLADTERIEDKPAHDNDVVPIDIDWVEHGHDGRKLVHTFHSYDRWKARQFRDDAIQTTISWGAEPTSRVQRLFTIFYRNGRLRANMIAFGRTARIVGHPEVTRPNSRSVRVTFPRWFIRRGNELNAYRYRVQVLLERHNRGYDEVPSGGPKIIHRL